MRPTAGTLGGRLVLAFALVSLVTVSLLALAAQVAVERGIRVAGSGAAELAASLAASAAQAYTAAGGWQGADLDRVVDGADEGVAVAVRDLDGTLVAGTDPGRGPVSSASVEVDGRAVGTVSVRSPAAGGTGWAADRGLRSAWSWIALAALASLVLAVLAGWGVTRWLTRPLVRLAEVARAFARGERGARAAVAGVGEVADLARGFNEAADAVERSAAARRQLAADVAHELRTPLGALQAGLEELRDGYLPADTAAISRLHDQVVRLGRVVGDLGLLADVQDPRPTLLRGRTDLAELVRTELAARTPELRAAGLALAEPALTPAEVRADPDRWHQVVGNLLANCARHCRPGDTVVVRLTTHGGEALLEVEDDGPGIPPADLPHVLDRYWRGAGDGVPGSGLGLAVVKEIVEAHGGAVQVTSGRGTQVRVTVPLAD